MTDFFTPCWKSALLDRLTVWLTACFLIVTPMHGAHAQAGSEVTQLRLERTADGIELFANVQLALPVAVEDALGKGVAMVFLAEADIVRHRWYWTDQKMARAQRHMRLAYQPLTRRWRLNVASGSMSPNSLGLALNLNFDSLEEAMATIQRISSWKIADASVIDADATYKVEFRFGLDTTQLPRVFQIGAFGQSDWSIGVSATGQIGPEKSR